MIIQHMKTDPNALKHARGGMFVAIFCGGWFAILLPQFAWWGLLVGQVAAFIAGIAVELWQRWQRRRVVSGKLVFTGKGQNSIKESLLDIMQTGLFYITYWVNRDKKKVGK